MTCPPACRLCRAVCTGTRPGLAPPSGRGRGGGDAGSLLPGVLPPESGACATRSYRQRHVRYTIVRTTTTTTTTTTTRRFTQELSAVGMSDREGDSSAWRRRQRRLRSWWPHERMTQPWCWAYSSARSPTGTDACELREKAAGCPEGARAASGCGARGLPVLRGSSSRHPVSGWWRRRREWHDHAVPPPEGFGTEAEGGGEEERGGEAAGGEVRGEGEAAQRQGQPRPAAH